MMIWGTPVTALQFFGYSIALGGLVYYKLGADQIKDYAGKASLSWAEYGRTNPAMRKAIVFGAGLLFIFLLVGGLAPSYAGDNVSIARVKDMLGGSAGTGGVVAPQ
jgi:hypothetical protein